MAHSFPQTEGTPTDKCNSNISSDTDAALIYDEEDITASICMTIHDGLQQGLSREDIVVMVMDSDVLPFPEDEMQLLQQQEFILELIVASEAEAELGEGSTSPREADAG